MTSLLADVLLNILLVGLLSATITYCAVLNRRIKVLQDSKSELASLLQQFDDSTIKASETIVAMQNASKKIGDNIQVRVDKANYVLDDLSYAMEKASRLSNQLEAGLAVRRAHQKAEDRIEPEPPVANHSRKAFETTLSEDIDEKPPLKVALKRSSENLEAILEKVTARKRQMQDHAGTPNRESSSLPPGRSRAEQELIDLIRSSKGQS